MGPDSMEVGCDKWLKESGIGMDSEEHFANIDTFELMIGEGSEPRRDDAQFKKARKVSSLPRVLNLPVLSNKALL